MECVANSERASVYCLPDEKEKEMKQVIIISMGTDDAVRCGAVRCGAVWCVV